MPATLVIQSHRTPWPQPWLADCVRSVQTWAEQQAFTYRFIGDELFEPLASDLRDRCADRLVVATDLARLVAAEQALEEGFDAVVWCDADMLVLDPAALLLPDEPFAVGREVWVEQEASRVRSRRQVHNAMMLFRAGNPFLRFYRYTAERIVRAHQGPMVPQLVGPKLLTALHNAVGLPVMEGANMLPPDVLRDLVQGGGPCLDAWRRKSVGPPAALNLCASLHPAPEAVARLLEMAAEMRFPWSSST